MDRSLRIKSLLGREIFRLRNCIMRNRRLLFSAEKAKGNETSSLINSIFRIRNNYANYLEIGVEFGFTFEAVKIPKKTGVDPFPKFNTWLRPKGTRIYPIKSDYFFKTYKGKPFDLVYLDGLHTFEQTYKDLQNASRCITDGGLILIDDTVPCDEFSAIPNQRESYTQRELAGKVNTGSWHGDVFKLLWVLSEFLSEELNWYTLVDLENPKTLVSKKSQKTYGSIFEIPVNIENASKKTFAETFNGMQSNVIRPIQTKRLLELLSV